MEGQILRLEAAYEKYADMLYRLALSHMNHQEDAEDVVQEVFVKYMNHKQSFQDEVHERAWLIRVTVNACYDLLRYKNRRNHTALDEIAETAAAEETNMEIFKMLEQLPPKYKTVLVLHYLEGFTVEEISFMLRVSKSAIKMRLSRGREQLKELIEKEGFHVS